MSNEQLCGICLQELSVLSTHSLSCRHEFHSTCIVDWFRCAASGGRCPICREGPAERELLDLRAVDEWATGDFTYGVSEAAAHRALAPLIYGGRRRSGYMRPLVDMYIACRRRASEFRQHSRGGQTLPAALLRDCARASHVLLTVWALENDPLFPEVPLS